MPISATFGSVGDVVSLCSLIKDLVRAFDQSRGSSAEYQDIVSELRAFEEMLTQVKAFCDRLDPSAEFEGFRQRVNSKADQCQLALEKFLKRIEKFGPSLKEGGSGNRCADFVYKIRWLCHSDELTKFKAAIGRHSAAMN